MRLYFEKVEKGCVKQRDMATTTTAADARPQTTSTAGSEGLKVEHLEAIKIQLNEFKGLLEKTERHMR